MVPLLGKIVNGDLILSKKNQANSHQVQSLCRSLFRLVRCSFSLLVQFVRSISNKPGSWAFAGRVEHQLDHTPKGRAGARPTRGHLAFPFSFGSLFLFLAFPIRLIDFNQTLFMCFCRDFCREGRAPARPHPKRSSCCSTHPGSEEPASGSGRDDWLTH